MHLRRVIICAVQAAAEGLGGEGREGGGRGRRRKAMDEGGREWAKGKVEETGERGWKRK